VRLAALVESPDHVCTRYRLRAFEPHLRAAGHNLELHQLPRDWWGRLKVANRVRDVDAVILQRKLLSRPEVAILRRRAMRLWFDLDDAVWMRDSYSSKGFASWKRIRRFRTTVRAADAIIAGNDFLADNTTQAGARSAVVIPTCVDVKSYPTARHDGSGLELVWVGSSSTLRGLAAITPTLEAIGRQVAGARLKLVCDRFLRLRHLQIVEAPWSEATERDLLAAADVGISWVPDDPWSRGKCGLKVLQYMAAGLPVITNPVGVHPEMVRHGESGFLATTEAEWIEAIQTLARDPDLRRRMGTRGREVVAERYSVEVGAAKWVNLISALETGRATA
jgi:glycosyltransferase involved in cell wall biosynthesis